MSENTKEGDAEKSAAGEPEAAKIKHGGGLWYVYIIECENGQLYTGITTDLARRMKEHRSKKRGAKYFRISAAANLVYSETHPNRSSASKRESAIKRLRRDQKSSLILSLGTVSMIFPEESREGPT